MEKPKKPVEDKNYKHIVRIMNTDLKGDKNILFALRKIKGVSYMFANALCNTAGIEKTKKAGNLTEAEVKQLDDILKNPKKFAFPTWMLNRRNDYETGEDTHLCTTDMKIC